MEEYSRNVTQHRTRRAIDNSKDWPKIIIDYKNSGLQQKEFCKLHQLQFNQFSYQLHKGHKRQVQLNNKLAPIVLEDNLKVSPKHSSAHFVLEWPSGMKLCIPPQADPAVIAVIAMIVSVLGLRS